MLDAILLFPPISVSERYNKDVGNVGGHLPPLGIAILAAVLEENGFSVELIDGPVYRMDIDELVEHICKKNPRVIGISSVTATFFKAVKLAEKLKKRLPHTPIILGGHHATILPREIMEENDCFDVLVYGEGEKILLELMKKIKGNKDITKIRGTVYKKNGAVIVNPPMPPIDDLDTVPFPALHLYDMSKYIPLPNQYKRKPVMNMVCIRGCPYHCTFCSNNAIFGRRIRMKSPGRVIEEMKYYIEEYGIKEISFWDDTLTVNKQWLMDVCNLMIKKGLDLTWSCYGRANTVDPELLNKMAEAGCWNIFYGLESGNQDLLDIIEKGITIEQIRNAIKWTREAGIETRGSFMLCLPGETPEKAMRTVDFAIELDLDYAQFCITTPFPGTKLYDTASQYGTLKKDFSKYHIWAPVFVPFGYKDEKECEEVYKKAFRKFYMRPRYVWKRITSIRSIDDFVRNIKGLRMILGITK